MTTTAPAPPAAPPDRAGATLPPSPRPQDHRLIAAEVALFGVTFAAALDMSRLFVDWSYLPPLALGAAVAHLVSALCRRRGLGLPTTALASVVVLVLYLGVAFHRDTTLALIPTGGTFRAIGDDLSGAWHQFQSVIAPAPVEPGFVQASLLGVWFVAFIADWAAFRIWAPMEALLPAGTLVVFTGILGQDDGQVVMGVIFAAAVLVFLLQQRLVHTHANAQWVASDLRGGLHALRRAGTGLAVASVVGALLLAPTAVAHTKKPIIDVGNHDKGGGNRVTISPLVDIQARLLNQPDTEVFTVTTKEPSYWRLTALDEFTGVIWSSSGSYRKANGSLPRDVDPSARRDETVRQKFTIEGLSQIWLPAAFEPRSIDPGSTDVQWDPITSTLVVDTSVPTSDGATYVVQSAIPRFSAAALRTATNARLPKEVRRDDLELVGVSARVRNLAAQVTASARTPYDKAIALQRFFRDGFTYNLDVPPGHGENAMERFLFQTRQGYCEQFAGTFAAMARSIGLPARVAVGFTWGEPDRFERDVYRVKAKHAHAWPEVYLDGFGWVPFEPTPGRGPVGGDYLGIPPEQAADTGGGGTQATAPTTTPTTQPNATQSSRAFRDTEKVDTNNGPAGTTGRHSPWPGRLRVLGLAAAALVAAYLLAVLGGRALLRRRRRRHAVGPEDRARVAWDETTEALAIVGVRNHPSETYSEYVTRTAPVADVDLDTYLDLARVAERADYAPSGIDPEDAERAEEVATVVGDAVRRRATRMQRVRRRLDPRPLVPARRGGTRIAQERVTAARRD